MSSGSNTVELIKERVDIVTVIQKYLTLKNAGKNFLALCPFHSEKTPSFNISPDLQIFKCFGCGKSGDVITFIEEIEKIDFKEAIEKLAKDAGIELPKDNRPEPFKLYYDMNIYACEVYRKYLNNTPVASKYMTERGFTTEDFDKFRIGYAPKDNSLLKSMSAKFKVTQTQLLQSGLFIERDGQIKDKFRDRIVFPITSATGKIVGFTGRILPGNDYGPKYLHTPETPIFHKSTTVYGLYQAKRGIRQEELCIVCEGTTDVIASHRIGISNIVAPLGTSLTRGQINLVSQFTSNILYIFDSDLAGQKALERAYELSEAENINSYAVNTSPYKDLDEMIQSDPKEISKRIARKSDVFTYLINQYLESNTTVGMEAQIKLKKYIKTLLGYAKSTDRRQYYIDQIKKIFPNLVEVNEQSNPQNRNQGTSNSKPTDLTFEELYLKCLLGLDPISIPKHHNIGIFKNPKVIEIVKTISLDGPIVTKLLHTKLEEPLQKYFQEIAFSKVLVSPEELDMIYTRIEVKYLKMELEDLKSKLAIAESLKNEKEIENLFKKTNELTAKIKEKQR